MTVAVRRRPRRGDAPGAARPARAPSRSTRSRVDRTARAGWCCCCASRASPSTSSTRRRPPATAARVLVLDDRLDDAERAELRRLGAPTAVSPSSPTRRARWSATRPTSARRTTRRCRRRSTSMRRARPTCCRATCTIGALAALRGVFVRDGVVFAAAGRGRRAASTSGGRSFVVHPAGRRRRGRRRSATTSCGPTRCCATPTTRRWPPRCSRRHRAARCTSSSATDRAHGPADVGSGDETLADLVRPGVWMALVQLVLAFVVFAIARGIRPGRPVDEPLPAPVAGSELVVATGQLMQRAHHAARAGWILRGETYRELCRALQVPTTTQIAELDRAAPPSAGSPRRARSSAALGTSDSRLVPAQLRRTWPTGCAEPARPTPTKEIAVTSFPEPRRSASPTHRADRRPGARRATPCSPCATRSARSSSASRACSAARSPRCSSTATCCSEGVPGVAKTLLAKTLAAAFDMRFSPAAVHARPDAVRRRRPDAARPVAAAR